MANSVEAMMSSVQSSQNAATSASSVWDAIQVALVPVFNSLVPSVISKQKTTVKHGHIPVGIVSYIAVRPTFVLRPSYVCPTSVPSFRPSYVRPSRPSYVYPIRPSYVRTSSVLPPYYVSTTCVPRPYYVRPSVVHPSYVRPTSVQRPYYARRTFVIRPSVRHTSVRHTAVRHWSYVRPSHGRPPYACPTS